ELRALSAEDVRQVCQYIKMNSCLKCGQLLEGDEVCDCTEPPASSTAQPAAEATEILEGALKSLKEIEQALPNIKDPKELAAIIKSVNAFAKAAGLYQITSASQLGEILTQLQAQQSPASASEPPMIPYVENFLTK